jgi:hypothetical protein
MTDKIPRKTTARPAATEKGEQAENGRPRYKDLSRVPTFAANRDEDDAGSIGRATGIGIGAITGGIPGAVAGGSIGSAAGNDRRNKTKDK